MTIQKNDFIQIEFTGKTTNDNEIFDTNKKEDLPKDLKQNPKPFILSAGNKMLPTGFDEDLIGKETEKEYTINLTPEKAFGKRDKNLIQMIPTKYFHVQKIEPIRGMQLSLDNQLVKVLSSDRGRTLVDFNNPLAGKPITYTYKIKRVITDQKEKVNALQDFLIRKRFDFDINEGKITFKTEKQFEPIIKLFTPKFEEILEMKIETKITEEKKQSQQNT